MSLTETLAPRLIGDHVLFGFHNPGVDDRAVCRAQDSRSGGRISGGVPKEPDVTPINETKNK